MHRPGEAFRFGREGEGDDSVEKRRYEAVYTSHSNFYNHKYSQTGGVVWKAS